jgi:hypothetical protein
MFLFFLFTGRKANGIAAWSSNQLKTGETEKPHE